MSTEILERRSGMQETIRLLQDELAQTNGEVLLLTVEMDKRVEQRTAELRAAQVELQHKNAELLKRTTQLETAMKELEAFSYSVSHDLRAPLRRIDTFIQLLFMDHGPSINPEVRQCLEKVSKSATDMSRLIDDLLSFSRMGRAEMRETTFDMGTLVNDVLQKMAPELEGRNIELDVPKLPTIRGDPALLRQVWVNLLSNAVKYTRPRNPARIKVNASSSDGQWEFAVMDNGVGFDMKHSQKLFGVFQRLHHPKDFEGTGIGLANVQQIIRRHGGKVWAEARLNEGATFYFTLPMASEINRIG